jgi:hypothetical protein
VHFFDDDAHRVARVDAARARAGAGAAPKRTHARRATTRAVRGDDVGRAENDRGVSERRRFARTARVRATTRAVRGDDVETGGKRSRCFRATAIRARGRTRSRTRRRWRRA